MLNDTHGSSPGGRAIVGKNSHCAGAVSQEGADPVRVWTMEPRSIIEGVQVVASPYQDVPEKCSGSRRLVLVKETCPHKTAFEAALCN